MLPDRGGREVISSFRFRRMISVKLTTISRHTLEEWECYERNIKVEFLYNNLAEFTQACQLYICVCILLDVRHTRLIVLQTTQSILFQQFLTPSDDWIFTFHILSRREYSVMKDLQHFCGKNFFFYVNKFPFIVLLIILIANCTSKRRFGHSRLMDHSHFTVNSQKGSILLGGQAASLDAVLTFRFIPLCSNDL